MNRIASIAWIAVVMMFLASGCTFFEEVLDFHSISLSDPSDNEVDFEDQGGIRTISVKSNFAWKVTSLCDWCIVSPSAGKKDGIVTLSVLANDTGEYRESNVIIGDDDEYLLIKVMQEADKRIVAAQKSYVISASGGQFSVQVFANTEYDVDLMGTGWLSETGYKKENSSHTFEVSPNEGYDERKSTIIFRYEADGVEELVEVVQLQKDAIVLGRSDYELPAESGVFSLEIGSNVEYSVRISSDWLTIADTKAFKEEVIEFAYTENPYPYERSATIAFTDGYITRFVDVVQEYALVDYSFSFIHENPFMTIPGITPLNLSGTVFWGDGSQEPFDFTNVHEYGSNGTWTVNMELTGSRDGIVLEFSTLEGINEIDLSAL